MCPKRLGLLIFTLAQLGQVFVPFYFGLNLDYLPVTCASKLAINGSHNKRFHHPPLFSSIFSIYIYILYIYVEIYLFIVCGRSTYYASLVSVYYRWILVTELRFGTDFMASQQTSLNDLIAKFNIIAIFHLLACREWVSGFGFRFQRVFFFFWFFGWWGYSWIWNSSQQ